MKKRENQITVLAVGDRQDFDSFAKFDREKDTFLSQGFDYVSTNYGRLLKGKIPPIKTKKVIIFLFFPFVYWNRHIEYKNYKGLYGNHNFSIKFMRFWIRIDNMIRTLLCDKKIAYVNSPLLCGFCRDKLQVMDELSRSQVPQPQLYKIGHLKDMQERLVRGESFFIKPRYGSMGKGITFLSWSNWQTNFRFKNNKIINKRSDRGWRFRDITVNDAFLAQLLKRDEDILIEETINSIILRGMKVDLRIYTFFNKVVYVYPRKNAPDRITTNISQGGSGDPRILKMLPKHLLIKAEKIAEKISKVLNLNLAGIDIMLDKNLKDVYAVDVNVFSGFPKRKTFNLAKHIIKDLIHLSSSSSFFKKVS
ncbi:RimK family alpha-L-glutamate ligase [Candidatus Omnitrophota bacterium]